MRTLNVGTSIDSKRIRSKHIQLKHQGFTLLEVIVAISIFAVIGLGSWQVLDRVTTTKSQLETRSAQLRQLHRGLWLLARDIQGIVNRPVRNNIGEQDAAITSLVAGYPLLLTRSGWPNPLGEKRSTLQRVGYLIEPTEDGNKALIRHYWSVLDQATDSEPHRQVILENIHYFEVQFIDNEGKSSFHWPPKTGGETSSSPIPVGIRIRLNISPYGEIERLFAIRDVEQQST